MPCQGCHCAEAAELPSSSIKLPRDRSVAIQVSVAGHALYNDSRCAFFPGLYVPTPCDRLPVTISANNMVTSRISRANIVGQFHPDND